MAKGGKRKQQPVKDFQRVKHKVGKLKPGAVNATDTKIHAKRIRIKEQLHDHDDGDLVFEDEATQIRARVQQLSIKSRHYSAVIRKESYTALVKIFKEEPDQMVQSLVPLIVESLSKGFIDEDAQARNLVLSLAGTIMKRVSAEMLSAFFPHWLQFILLSLTHIEPAIKRDGLLFLSSAIESKPTLMVPFLVKILQTIMPSLSPKSSKALKKNGPSETDIIIQILQLYYATASKKSVDLLYEYTWSEVQTKSLLAIRRPPSTTGLATIESEFMTQIIERLMNALSDAWIDMVDNMNDARKSTSITNTIKLLISLSKTLDFGSFDFFWSALPRSLQNLLGKGGKQRLGIRRRMGKERLVIVGSGWAGFELLRGINRKLYDVHLISPRNYFVFTPLLASTCTGTLEFRSITEPIRRLDPTINYYQAECTGISLEKRLLKCQSLQGSPFSLGWDKLVLATGAKSNTFGIQGVTEHAFFLKEIEDARRIRHRILKNFELAKQPGIGEGEKDRLLHFAVVGGGPTGVEFAAELNDFIHDDLLKYYPDLAPRARTTVYDVASRILGSFDHKLAEYAMKRFARERISIATGTRIRQVHADALSIDGVPEPVGCGLVVWATGLTASPFVKKLGHGLELDDRGFRLMTDHSFNVLTKDGPHKDIYAIGDCATIKGYDLPCTAQVAYQKARHLSKVLNGSTDKPFVFHDRGMLAYIGGWRAIADLRAGHGHRFPQSGRMAWLFWRSAYFVMTVSLRNKVLIPMYWFLTWIFGRDITRIE